MEKIIQVFNNITPLSDRDRNSLNEILNSLCLDKGEYWIREGKKNYDIAFIDKGYLKLLSKRR